MERYVFSFNRLPESGLELFHFCIDKKGVSTLIDSEVYNKIKST